MAEDCAVNGESNEMILIKDVPQVPLRRALFTMLTDGQDHNVYGDVPEDAVLPWITIGGMIFSPIGSKTTVIWQAKTNIEAYSDGTQKLELNEMLNDICTLVSYYGNSLEIEGYSVIDTEIETVETEQESTTGYHGTVTAVFKLQKARKTE